MGSLSFLALGQEVIKQNQMPGAGRATSHVHDKMSWEQQTSQSDCLDLCSYEDEFNSNSLHLMAQFSALFFNSTADIPP